MEETTRTVLYVAFMQTLLRAFIPHFRVTLLLVSPSQIVSHFVVHHKLLFEFCPSSHPKSINGSWHCFRYFLPGGCHGRCTINILSSFLVRVEQSNTRKPCCIYRTIQVSLVSAVVGRNSSGASTPWKRLTTYDVPAGMPACPSAGCICAVSPYMSSFGTPYTEPYFLVGLGMCIQITLRRFTSFLSVNRYPMGSSSHSTAFL